MEWGKGGGGNGGGAKCKRGHKEIKSGALNDKTKPDQPRLEQTGRDRPGTGRDEKGQEGPP